MAPLLDGLDRGYFSDKPWATDSFRAHVDMLKTDTSDSPVSDKTKARQLFVEATAPMRYGSAVLGIQGQAKATLANMRLSFMARSSGKEELLGFNPAVYEGQS